jgi:MFS-type transporter involved in bile tolerance (Atg22 family)
MGSAGPTYCGPVAVGDRVDQFRALARQAIADLFDQRKPFGRLALVQVLMLAGDTLVTFSLAKSLFFSISPHEAKNKVLLYLLLTLAPFSVVSPLLGPLIDRSKGARRATAVVAAVGRAIICPFMAADIKSLLLFPEAFLVLVFSKLYLVTRGALVPEMMALTPATSAPPMRSAPDAFGPGNPHAQATVPAGEPTEPGAAPSPAMPGYAALNARLTLLGTLAGFVAAIPGVPILDLFHASGLLIFDTFVFIAAAIAALRLPVSRPQRQRGSSARSPAQTVTATDSGFDPDLASLQPVAEPQVLLGLTANSLLRGIAGFFVFMLAFGLRRLNAGLFWYGFALGASGVGSLLGLVLVPRLRRRFTEQQILLTALWLVGVIGTVTALIGDLPAQGLLALGIGIGGSLGQPSFDAITQRNVPEEQQGRVFAKFATRQQLVWVVGALVPVVISMPLAAGDVVIAATGAIGGLFYLTSRRALHTRALPRQFRRSEAD